MSGNVAFSNTKGSVNVSKVSEGGSGGGLGLSYVTNGIVLRWEDVGL